MRSQSLILTCLLVAASALAGLAVLVSPPAAQAGDCTCPGDFGDFLVVDGSGIAASCTDARVACQEDATTEARDDCASRDQVVCEWGAITYSECIPWEDQQFAVSCEQEYSCKVCEGDIRL